MEDNELQQALFSQCPVLLHDMRGAIEYKYVSALIYRIGPRGNLVVSAELADRCGHSVTIASPEQISRKGKEG